MRIWSFLSWDFDELHISDSLRQLWLYAAWKSINVTQAWVGGVYVQAPWLRLHPRWVWELYLCRACSSFTLISGQLRTYFASTVRNTPLNGRIIGVAVSLWREFPAAVPQCLAFVLNWRVIECAGRCCAPEHECFIRAGCGLCSVVCLFMVQP